MDPVKAIRHAQSTALVDEDGDEVVLALGPGLAAAEIETLRAELGVPLPHELRALLEHTARIDGALETIDFTGRALSFGGDELFPSGLPIAHDGYGNHWVLDLTPDEAASAPVFFACHDPAVVLFQSPDLGHFLHETFRMYVPPHASLVDDVHEDRLFHVWRTNPGELDHAAALAGDESLRAFAAELDERFAFVDLRAPEIGMGFSWGRFGPRTEVRRHGYERLFAFARPEKRPGLLRRLLA
jgi:cell wall assembly regulator SMI1